MPTITELRCRACTVKGGMVVGSAAEVEALSEIPLVRIAVAEQRMPKVQVGDHVELRPCILKDDEMRVYREEHEKGMRPWPCPLVDLFVENVEALELFWIATNEEARGYAGLFSDALLSTYSDDERVRILRRAMLALGDARIVDARQRLRTEAIEKHRLQQRK